MFDYGRFVKNVLTYSGQKLACIPAILISLSSVMIVASFISDISRHVIANDGSIIMTR